MYRSTGWALTALVALCIALLLARVEGPAARLAAQIGAAITFAFFPYCLRRAVQLLARSRVHSDSGRNAVVGERSSHHNPPLKVPAAQARWKP